MGCFSFMCEECGEPVNSDSFSGEFVHLFLLKDGKVIEKMAGQYDSYGRVFDENMESVSWKSMEWGDICTLMSNSNSGDGIAVIHGDCYKGEIPIEKSEDDAEQGWGEYSHTEDGECYHE